MKVRIKTPDGLPLAYESSGACAFDFKAAETVTFAPKEFKLVETGTVVETPKSYVLQISPRSSTFKNFGLILANSVGVIDCDFCGDKNTIKFAYVNLRDVPVTVEKGTRIGQGMFLRVDLAEFETVETMGDNKNRGEFGSTGGHGKQA